MACVLVMFCVCLCLLLVVSNRIVSRFVRPPTLHLVLWPLKLTNYKVNFFSIEYLFHWFIE